MGKKNKSKYNYKQTDEGFSMSADDVALGLSKMSGICSDCPTPKICAKQGCVKEKVNEQSFMGDKYEKRKAEPYTIHIKN